MEVVAVSMEEVAADAIDAGTQDRGQTHGGGGHGVPHEIHDGTIAETGKKKRLTVMSVNRFRSVALGTIALSRALRLQPAPGLVCCARRAW
jgi:hypothetical protein